MVISGCWDNYGKPITSNIVDRLKGKPFRVPLLDTWKPYLLAHAPYGEESFIGDEQKGDCAYLLPVQDSTGQVAIAEVRDTVFSLLPTTSPVPMKSQFGTISYYTPVVVDRQSQRGYIMGSDTLCRKYILCIDYAKRPAPLTLYYTDSLADANGCIPILTPEGHLVAAGGIAHGGTWFTPTAAVWLFPVGDGSFMASQHHPPLWPWLLLAGLALLALLAYLIIKKARSTIVEQTVEAPVSKPSAPLPPDGGDEELMRRIIRLVEDKQMYLNSSLKLSDIASELGVHQNEVSACINSNKGSSFSQFVNGYRIDYAKQLILRQPELKMSVVAEQSGFASESVFFRTFKSFVGATPKEWAVGSNK
jgi:AraC-like DNA-binding protein